MADLNASAPELDRIRADYLAQTQRKRVYGGILLILFVSLMEAGFQTADARNAGSFVDGWQRIFDYPVEVLSDAWVEVAQLPAHKDKEPCRVYAPPLPRGAGRADDGTGLVELGSCPPARGFAGFPPIVG